MSTAQAALKYDSQVLDGGRLELAVPYPTGTRVIIFVVQDPEDEFRDMLSAAQSSLSFWDNPLDDEDWNNA